MSMKDIMFLLFCFYADERFSYMGHITNSPLVCLEGGARGYIVWELLSAIQSAV